MLSTLTSRQQWKVVNFAIAIMDLARTVEELKTVWVSIPNWLRRDPRVIAHKDMLKERLAR